MKLMMRTKVGRVVVDVEVDSEECQDPGLGLVPASPRLVMMNHSSND